MITVRMSTNVWDAADISGVFTHLSNQHFAGEQTQGVWRDAAGRPCPYVVTLQSSTEADAASEGDGEGGVPGSFEEEQETL